MPEETSEQIDQKIDDEPVNYIPAITSVIAIIAIPAIYTRIVRKRRAREMKTDNQPQTVDDFLAALQDTPTMYFCNN